MLLKEIRAIAGETLVLSPDDPAAENVNTNWFGAPPHERMGLSADEVVTAFEETIAVLRSQVTALRHDGPATFYVWHDQLAGQLRCSTGSCAQDKLPLESSYRLTGDLHAIVVEFLHDRAPGAIAWGEMEPIPYSDGPEASDEDTFPVWVCDLRDR
ncbi:hypothetical protein [Paractinoplanes rishiriensis]|uniref:Uncharacterized protein n=1 Tax=Paractinoplanes rishiriensis TaxID=1050105 RepID=A0A919KBL1_9ACTN|nr:hypothetical protein [Actinoplanes rishiriensis]GIF00347.1 hypothetical protein Ari01nite_78110 [Actinoplanes rishiriensis]